jgi:L-amino acid N-acyltransferase YncA
MRENCGTKKFLAITPYEAAKKYAERVGFNYVATLINSIKKNGQLLDQFLLEMN